ncbi:enoyl-CoA hydratase/isomerase family protein [Nocardioides hwasunensis]|uniref:Enoyl-CoA hydratase/isomerase family protein n=1 Tax=Nocardioides hwasunensis TaxID=397258 RepID=A0ABR8MNJ0_9ACTN|nr:enoyl-CoA hydratase-related protein [Nocardioides hwasunensis]MBD3916372.1 enoyl-CoA hydratase/isomerase family protein [Nocardioides hwasunensis]
MAHTPEPQPHQQPSDRTVLVDVRDAVATVTLNRPERRNAVSWQLMVELRAAFASLAMRRDVRVVVLAGAEGDFSVGADMARVGSDDVRDQETRTLRGRSAKDDRERLAVASEAVQRLVELPQPTIARITGACAGAGLSLALAADLRVASPTAVFNTAFVSAGVAGDLGSAWLLTRAVGPGRARALLLDPRRLTAAEATEHGIVTELAADVDARVHELGTKLADQAPMAMALAKDNLRDALVLDLPDYLRAEVPRMVESARSDDAKQAARAFVAKRAAARRA